MKDKPIFLSDSHGDNPAMDPQTRLQIGEALRSQYRARPAQSGPLTSLLDEYFDAVRDLYHEWNPSILALLSTFRRTTLDEMWRPLRLVGSCPLGDRDKVPILNTVDDVVLFIQEKGGHLTIRGEKGCGKTTAMRKMFRALLTNQHALPLMIECNRITESPYLREGAATTSQENAIETIIGSFLSVGTASTFKPTEGLDLILWEAQYVGKPVILMIDGLNELKEPQRLLRLVKQFRDSYSDTSILITSNKPSHYSWPMVPADAASVTVQPLSLDESKQFAHKLCDQFAALQSLEQGFFRFLEKRPVARCLVRTPQGVKNVLFVMHGGITPDDKVYCFHEQLLRLWINAARTKGARKLDIERQDPAPNIDHRRVLSRVGYILYQHKGVTITPGVLMGQALPEQWTQEQKHSFVKWMTDDLCLLNEMPDHTLAMEEGSLDYLAARHLNATIDGAQERAQFFKKETAPEQWAVMRLFSEMVHDRNPAFLEVPMTALIESDNPDHLAFAGILLADGLGTEAQASLWLQRVSLSLQKEWSESLECFAEEWASGIYEKGAFYDRLIQWLDEQAVQMSSWLVWSRIAEFKQRLGHSVPPPLPHDAMASALIRAARNEVRSIESWFGAQRVMAGACGIWPTFPLRVGLLQLWPSRRRVIGLLLQCAANAGAAYEDLKNLYDVLQFSLRFRESAQEIEKLAVAIESWWERAGSVVRDIELANAAYTGLGRELAEYWLRYWYSLNLGLDDSIAGRSCYYWSSDYSRHYAPLNLETPLPETLLRFITRFVRRQRALKERVRQFKERLGQYSDVSKSTEVDRWFEDFVYFAISALGFGAVRVVGAHLDESLQLTENDRLLVDIIACACRLSLGQATDRAILNDLTAEYSGADNVLWRALAHRVSGETRAEDTQVLESFARQSDKGEDSVFEMGRRFIIQGDVIMRDRTIWTLDEIANDVGTEKLPYVD